ncbi:shikimate dehydrogenase [Rhizobium oryzicola]|uniref:Shikimate dehydrogenase (NADP(+)) n=1 Tax=Rhizobium oryzicola TaxID=1232668 RepID=A0ABT8T259_9HYPH|nr:shikimate dehydrogenase [Rhizobium oryzicola]MDO1584728.1 shikimate dehydrogenase [Rhizobium oryzicola]
MFDSRETSKAFVVGSPIRHSRSPMIHGHWLKQFGLAGSYEAIEVWETDFPAFVKYLKKEALYRGGNVTIPHKERACQLVDRLDETAREIGAANTLWLEDGLLHATNTDAYGFAANLDERHPGWDHVSDAVVLGAGGASRAIIQALKSRSIASIHVVNRTEARARELADRFGERVHAHAMPALTEVLQGAGLFINTTSLGMDGEGEVDIDFSSLASGAVVTDIVYVPLETPVLKQAKAQGFATVDGLGMLLHQAVPGFEKWFGQRPQVTEELRQLIIADMAGH